jgi:hypothetical protein
MTEECFNNDRANDMSAEDQEMNRDEFMISHSGPTVLSNRFFIARGVGSQDSFCGTTSIRFLR